MGAGGRIFPDRGAENGVAEVSKATQVHCLAGATKNVRSILSSAWKTEGSIISPILNSVRKDEEDFSSGANMSNSLPEHHSIDNHPAESEAPGFKIEMISSWDSDTIFEVALSQSWPS